MDEKEYSEIYNYLTRNKLPTEIHDERNFKKKMEKYLVKNDRLYRRKEDKILEIKRRYELEPLFYWMHDNAISGHLATEIMYHKIKERYYWPKMMKDIEIYVKSCDQCQKRNKPQGKNQLHSIKVKAPFYQIGIDIVGPLNRTIRNKKYIVTAIDYFTKYVEAKALENANAEEVSTFIFEEIICRHGCPKVILSDRGSHFNNQVIEELMKKFKIKHNFSTPYHPKTNGLVERFNRTLCESLAKLSEERENWDEYIAPTLFAYRTSRQSTTKIDPFYLTYGRKAILPIDNDDREMTIEQRIKEIFEDIPEIRNKAKRQIEISQERQKKYHDKKITKEHKFEIGDKVLYYNAAKEKQWSGKLEEKWKGPYYIHEVLMNGSYKLKNEINGRILKTPVNGELLKKYHERQNFIPYVVV